MNLRLQDILVTPGEPFENCKLDRKKYAKALTRIVETYSDGFVLALNNKWGEGKTTFLKMWRVYLGNLGYKTLYFNAWEHDFNHDPLSAILSELKSLDIYEKQEFAPLLKKGAKLTRSLIPIFLSAIAEKYIDTKILKEAFQKLTEEATSIFEEEVNEYANKKKGLEDFKIELEAYISKLDKRPLVFFIDELDRCNPKYAVEFLEIVKHFFSVPGIVFVLSIDKDQLGNSIRGYFGSEHINTDEYLRRFIDLEFSIPKPEINTVVDWMFLKYNFANIHEKFSTEEHKLLKKISVEYLRKADVSIRFIEKLFLQIKLTLDTIEQKKAVFSECLFILILIKQIDSNFYRSIKDKSISTKEFIKGIQKFIEFNDSVKKEFKLNVIEVKFAYLYSNNFEKNYNQDIISEVQAGKFQLIYTPQFDESENFTSSIRLINDYRNNYMCNYNLDYLINKIELLDSLQ